MNARVIEQVAERTVRQRCRTAGEETSPQDVTAKQPTVIGREEAFRKSRVGEYLESALMVEVADEGGNDPILPKKNPHAVERMAALPLERDQVAHLVIPVGNVDPDILVIDFAVPDHEFAGIGVREIR
jgi:hypothetical protein